MSGGHLGVARDGRCPRWRLRSSLTHLEVRSLRCSAPPWPRPSGATILCTGRSHRRRAGRPGVRCDLRSALTQLELRSLSVLGRRLRRHRPARRFSVRRSSRPARVPARHILGIFERGHSAKRARSVGSRGGRRSGVGNVCLGETSAHPLSARRRWRGAPTAAAWSLPRYGRGRPPSRGRTGGPARRGRC